MKIVCVIGEGAWGTAVAILLSENGYTVKLWCHDPEVAACIASKHVNERYLPGIKLSDAIQPITKLEEAICDVQWVFEAIPVQYLRSVLKNTVRCFSPEQVWVVLSKGIEHDTLLLSSQIIDDVFAYETKKAVVAGPSFAHELATKQITAVTIASTDCTVGKSLQLMLANSYFRPYISLDMIGVQIGSAIKNVITLAVGMLDGAGFDDNCKAYLLTRGLDEMVKIALALGGRQETVYGLSGVGDLVLTSMGSLSRNLIVGRRLGHGDALEEILADTGFIPEGINTTKSVYRLAQQKKLDVPICQGVYDIIFGEKKIEQLLQELIERPLEQECKV